MTQTIGIIGLGIMGSAFSTHLINAGFKVIGYDVLPERIADLNARGGAGAVSCIDVAQAADVIITSLPSMDALERVTSKETGLAGSLRQGLTVIETSTLTLASKLKAHQVLHSAGIEFLDCPVSGSGAQAALKDIVLYTSGRSCGMRCLPADLRRICS